MAYAAVISLKQTMERLLNSSYISIVPPSLKILEFAYKEVQSLQEVLKRLDRSSSRSRSERVNALDRQIREAVRKLEDVLETHVSNQFLGDESDPLLFSLDLHELKQDTAYFTQTVKKMKKMYIKELRNPLPEEDDDGSSRIDFGGKKSKMVGFSDEFRIIIDRLRHWWKLEVQVVSLVGMAGIGKTTLAKEVFEDSFILNYFDFRAWVTVGPKCQLREILQGIVAQVNPDTDEMLMEQDDNLAQYLKEIFKGRRYLIVLDDVWNKRIWHDFKRLFPDNNTGSRVLLTTRLEEVARDASNPIFGITNIRFMNKEESWHLLREKVFAEELCPPQLEKAGKKIAENCEGLPLLILTIAQLLSKLEKTPEYWNKVAEKENSVFVDAYDKISKVLFPSYEYLPQHLKACFLYMGVFPQNYEIPCSKLIKLWGSEGFLEPNWWNSLEDLGMECVEELVSRSLVIVRQQSSNGRIKTCSLHSVFWHLCIREAGKNKFFHVLNSRADGLAEGIKSQLRLCIHKSILFGIKDVHNSMEAHCASTARSLLCTGPPHQYPVPICFGLRLVRVLDALTTRFYEFPMEVLKLVHLRYLALTCNGNLPPSISKLWNLQFLIVRRHLSINSSGTLSYLPMEIWDMKELKHLQFMGSNLPFPCDDTHGAHLQNLLTLLDVSAHSCTKEVLERFPNLKKLGIQIELASDAAEPLCCFDHISHLHFLESLKCVIVNPNLRSQVVATPVSITIFPAGLKKLSLSGFGYPWEYMRMIASLPNLEVLKLRCYAFRGPDWETCEGEFSRLKYLLLEDTDLIELLFLGQKNCKYTEHIVQRSFYIAIFDQRSNKILVEN
ncbi:hypothetical protein Pfo_026838 [Paulownia fortunei]|nr:hypothetical protein Pfo_026838 [Paulownia fortunei]